jgi:hypothetical protein
MWTCPQCDRIFDKESQPHSCKKVQLEHHFAHKAKAKELFEYLVSQVGKKVGTCQIISLPCCVHLFGSYDFLAALPKKDRLEIRFALNRKLNTPRLKVCVSMSVKVFKNCFDLYSKEEIDTELLNWLNESYHRK